MPLSGGWGWAKKWVPVRPAEPTSPLGDRQLADLQAEGHRACAAGGGLQEARAGGQPGRDAAGVSGGWVNKYFRVLGPYIPFYSYSTLLLQHTITIASTQMISMAIFL